jgi:hypothetical protein
VSRPTTRETSERKPSKRASGGNARAKAERTTGRTPRELAAPTKPSKPGLPKEHSSRAKLGQRDGASAKSTAKRVQPDGSAKRGASRGKPKLTRVTAASRQKTPKNTPTTAASRQKTPKPDPTPAASRQKTAKQPPTTAASRQKTAKRNPRAGRDAAKLVREHATSARQPAAGSAASNNGRTKATAKGAPVDGRDGHANPELVAYESEVLSVLASELTGDDPREADAKIEQRLRVKQLGAFDSARVEALRSFKTELADEIHRGSRSLYFTGAHGLYASPEDFDHQRLVNDFSKKHPDISHEAVTAFIPIAVYWYYLR